MSEYITRERALEILNDIGGCGAEPESYTAGWDEAINAAYEAIQSEPAADVAPVVHGHWISEYIGYGVTRYRCSRCGVIIGESEIDDFGHSKYCCMCGAKMDGTPCE